MSEPTVEIYYASICGSHIPHFSGHISAHPKLLLMSYL